MGWEVLILPLLGFTVWLISNLVRMAEEKKPDKSAAKPKGAAETYTDMDRFLQQVRQKRESNPQPQRRPRPKLNLLEADDAPPVEAPVVNRRLLKDLDPTGRPVVMMELVPDEKPLPTKRAVEAPLTPAPPPPPPQQTNDPPTPPSRRPAEVEETASQAAVRLAMLVPTNARQPSPVLAQVIRLLRTPQSAGAAIILREILDPPPSARGRTSSTGPR